jgi:hypothetical protein
MRNDQEAADQHKVDLHFLLSPFIPEQYTAQIKAHCHSIDPSMPTFCVDLMEIQRLHVSYIMT